MRLFCYGSLKNGFSAHGLISEHNPTFVGKIRTQPHYHLYKINWFPGMIYDNDMKGEGVEGEVYEINENCLPSMDYYEGVSGGLFRREEIELADGTKATAYLFNQSIEGKRHIDNGVWE